MMCKLILDPVEDRSFIARCEANHIKWIDLFQDLVDEVVSKRMRAFMIDPAYDMRSEFLDVPLDAPKDLFKGEVNPLLTVRPM